MKSEMLPIIFLSPLLLAATVSAQPELKGTIPELAALLTNAPRIAHITGEAEIKVQADRAIVTVKVSTTAKELGQALRANQQARNKFINQLTAQGIPADQVKPSNFSSTEKYALLSDKVKSHRVNNLLKITVRNEKEFQAVAEATDSIAETQYLGADFERSDKEEMKTKAIAQACDNAAQRKQAFEEKLAVKLTVRRFIDPSGVPVEPREETGQGGTRAMGYQWYLGSTISSDYSDSKTTHALAQREDSGLGFGELTFRSRVTIEYLVENR